MTRTSSFSTRSRERGHIWPKREMRRPLVPWEKIKIHKLRYEAKNTLQQKYGQNGLPGGKNNTYKVFQHTDCCCDQSGVESRSCTMNNYYTNSPKRWTQNMEAVLIWLTTRSMGFAFFMVLLPSISSCLSQINCKKCIDKKPTYITRKKMKNNQSRCWYWAP